MGVALLKKNLLHLNDRPRIYALTVIHASNTIPGYVRREVSEQLGMCFHYIEQIHLTETKLGCERNFRAKNLLITEVELLYENLTANFETLPELNWAENLEKECEDVIFFEILVNNIKNMVPKLQNNIYKVKNKRKKNLTFELKELKTNYVANQAEIFRKEKELSILIESELKAELALIKGFERMNNEKITPHFL
jgi:hypothetical protein